MPSGSGAVGERHPLHYVQLFSLEFQPACNLAHVHTLCPASLPHRYDGLHCDRRLDDETILQLAEAAYLKYDFAGLICWHGYNEPLLDHRRMFALMGQIRERVPQARFLLWTNGMRLPDDLTPFAAFSEIQVTDYGGEYAPSAEKLARLREVCPNTDVNPGHLDTRLSWPGTYRDERCTKPLNELIVDVYGNFHICCFDWQGKASPGNVYRDGIDACFAKWAGMVPAIVRWPLDLSAPALCQRCPYRHARLPGFSKTIRRWAKAWVLAQDDTRAEGA